MRLDKNLIQRICLEIESSSKHFLPEVPEIEGYTKREVIYHIYIMVDGKLLSARVTKGVPDPLPVDYCNICLTYLGHKWIDLNRDKANDVLFSMANNSH